MSSVQKHALLVVTQIDTQALPDSARARANVLIGLVAEERIRRNHPFLKNQGVGSNQGLAATYTEHGSITSEKPENRSKSGACNHRELTLPPISI